jgi:hypothetical protein
MLAGAISSPQKEVMELLSNNYSFRSIISKMTASASLQPINRKSLSLYPDSHLNALIVGGGDSVDRALVHLQDLVDKEPNMLIVHLSSNHVTRFSQSVNKQIFCLHGDETIRLSNLDFTAENYFAVLAAGKDGLSTVPPPNISSIYSIEYDLPFDVTHLNLAISVLLELKVRNVHFCGFDGYNYPNPTQMMLQKLNEESFKYISDSPEFDLTYSVTKTSYDLETKPIFSICD